MTPSVWTKIAATIALLASGPTLAETTDHHVAARVTQIARAVSEAAAVAKGEAARAGADARMEAVKLIPQVRVPSVTLPPHHAPVDHYLANVLRPIVNATQHAADWIAYSANAAAIAVHNTSRWIAGKANCVASAARNSSNWIVASTDRLVLAVREAENWTANRVTDARNTGDWIVASSDRVALALHEAEQWTADRASEARNTSQWVASASNELVASAQGTGQWIAASSTAAVDLAVNAASYSFSALTAAEDWSANLVKHVENHLRADPNSEFAILLKQSGFVMTDVQVGIGIIPDLTVEFRHEQDLTPDEMTAFKAKVDAYLKTATGPVAYFEGHLLRRLVKVGDYAAGLHVNQVLIDVFPLPGLQVFYDPLGVEGEQNKIITDAYEIAQEDGTDLKSMEDRLAKIEAALSASISKQ